MAVLTVILVLACLATRNWSGAVLATVAEPAAGALTESVLKPYVGRIDQARSFPSGHATSLFALAAVCRSCSPIPRTACPERAGCCWSSCCCWPALLRSR